MSGQIATMGAMAAANLLTGAVVPNAGTNPPAWEPGMVWYNTSLGQWETNTTPNSLGNSTGWSTGVTPGQRWLALLTADPVANSAVYLSDTGFQECTTTGYSRQPVTFNMTPDEYPSICSNAGVIQFNFSSTALLPIQWVAMVTVGTGTAGIFLMSWVLAAPVVPDISQSVQIGVGQLVVQAQ